MRRFLIYTTLGVIALVALGGGLLFLRNYQMNEATLKFKENNGIVAIEQLKPLAYLGDKTAKFLLGNAYAFGWGGVQKSDANAIYWFRRLGSFGPVVVEEGVDPAAPYALGIAKIYASGAQGVQANSAESLKWLKLAAEGGSKEAAVMLDQIPH